MALGNVGVSSLLRSAQSTQKQVQSLTDAQKAYDWQYGPQDQQAYNDYTSYLKSRYDSLSNSASLADHEKALSVSKEMISALHTYNTNQAQNMAIQVMQGNASDVDKLNLLGNQLKAAIAGGADPQTIQGLQSLYDHQAITVTNNQTTAANQAFYNSEHMQTALNKGYAQAENALKKFNPAANGDPSQMGLEQLKNAFSKGQISETDYAKFKIANYQALGQLYNQAAQDSNLSGDNQSHWGELADKLTSSPDYASLTSGHIASALQNGQMPFARVKGEDGLWDLKPLTEVAPGQYALNAKNAGQNVVKDVASSGHGSYNINKANLPEGETVYAIDPADPSKGYYYIDATTNKMIQIDPNTGQHLIMQNVNDKPVTDNQKLSQPGFLQGFEKGIDKQLPGAGNVIDNAARFYGQEAPQALSGISAAAHNLMPKFSFGGQSNPNNLFDNLAGGLNHLINPVEAALHPSHIQQTFSNLVANVTQKPVAQAPLQFAPMPKPAPQPYVHSVLYSQPTPYPNAGVPKTGATTTPQQNTNTVAAINKAVGFNPIGF